MTTTDLPTTTADPSIDDVLVVDVRTPGEFATAHVPGAVNLPLSMLEAHADEVAALLPDDAVLVCQSGARSEKARGLLASRGRDLTCLHGGLSAIEAAGGDVERGRDTWDLERQVRLVAGSIVLASGIASLKWPAARFVGTGIGGGLVYAAVSDTCTMGMVLSRMPHNRAPEPSWQDVAARLRKAGA